MKREGIMTQAREVTDAMVSVTDNRITELRALMERVRDKDWRSKSKHAIPDEWEDDGFQSDVSPITLTGEIDALLAALSPPPQVQTKEQKIAEYEAQAALCEKDGKVTASAIWQSHADQLKAETQVQDGEIVPEVIYTIIFGDDCRDPNKASVVCDAIMRYLEPKIERLVAENERLKYGAIGLRDTYHTDISEVRRERCALQAQLTAAQEISAEQEARINRLVHELTAAQDRERKMREAGNGAIGFWDTEGDGDTPDWVNTFRAATAIEDAGQ